jgi:hypothetical protein
LVQASWELVAARRALHVVQPAGWLPGGGTTRDQRGSRGGTAVRCEHAGWNHGGVAADAEPRAAAVGAAEVASSGRLDPTRHAIALVLCCPLISLLRPCAGTAACAGSALHAELSLHREARPPRHVGRGGPAAPCWETFPAAGETGRAAAAEVLAPAAFRSLGAVEGGDDGIIAPAAWAPGEAACRRLRALRTHVTPQRAHGTAAAAGAQLAGFGAQQGKLLAEHYRRWGCCRREAAADLAASRGLVSRAPVERRGAVDALGPPCPDPGAFAFTDPSAGRRQDAPVAGADQSLPDVREPALAGCAPVDLRAGLCPLRGEPRAQAT